MLRELEGWITPKNPATDRAKKLIAKKTKKQLGQVTCYKCHRWEYPEFMDKVKRHRKDRNGTEYYLYKCKGGCQS